MLNPSYRVYEDGDIAVALFAKDADADQKDLLHLGVRWLLPKPCQRKDGRVVQLTNIMGGETDWFLLPHSFGVAVGRTLIEQKVSDCGLEQFFNPDGFKRMVTWLVEMEELTGSMCY